MKHYEFLYLLHRAHLLRKYIEKAESEGEYFYVSDLFSPLESGLMAQTQIRKIDPKDSEPSLILRLRYRPDFPKGAEIATQEAYIFFSNDKYKTLPKPIEENEWVEHVYFSSDIPRPVVINDSPNSIPNASFSTQSSPSKPSPDRS